MHVSGAHYGYRRKHHAMYFEFSISAFCQPILSAEWAAENPHTNGTESLRVFGFHLPFDNQSVSNIWYQNWRLQICKWFLTKQTHLFNIYSLHMYTNWNKIYAPFYKRVATFYVPINIEVTWGGFLPESAKKFHWYEAWFLFASEAFCLLDNFDSQINNMKCSICQRRT